MHRRLDGGQTGVADGAGGEAAVLIGVVGAVQIRGELGIVHAGDVQGIVDGGIGLEGSTDLGVVAAEAVIEHGGELARSSSSPMASFSMMEASVTISRRLYREFSISVSRSPLIRVLEVGEQAIQRRDSILLVEELIGIREEEALPAG